MNPLIETFGWTLIHFLWQAAIVAAVLWIALRFVHAARWRYVLSCCSLLAMLGCAAFSTAKYWPETKAAPPERITAASPVTPTVVEEESTPVENDTLPVEEKTKIANAPESTPLVAPVAKAGEKSAPGAQSWLPWVVALWAAGVAVLSLNFLRSWRALRRLRSTAETFTDAATVSVFRRLLETMGLAKPVALLCTDKTSVPLVVGWLRPAIIVPASLFARMPSWQVEAILAHELAHVRRHDYLVNLLQNVVETIFFYHPAVWWVSGQIRKEREHCCDDTAAATCGNVLDYARALTGLEEIRGEVPAGALSAAGGPLLGRIRRLLGVPARESVSVFSWPVGVAVALLVAGLFASVHFVQGQEPGDSDVKLPDAPEHGMSKSLLIRWQQLEEKESPLPERRVAGMRRVIGEYIEKESPKESKLTQYQEWRADQTEHDPADLLRWLNAIAAVNPELVQLAFNHEPRRGVTGERDEAKFGPPAPNGLRASWDLSPRKETYVLGDFVNATLTLWNTGSETLMTGNGRDAQSPGIRPEPVFLIRGADGRTVPVKAEPVDPVGFTAKWILRPGEAAVAGGYRIKIGEGEQREATFPTKHWSHFSIPGLRSGEAVTMGVTFPYPKSPNDTNDYPVLAANELKFSVIHAKEKKVWATNRYGTWPMADGVTMEVRGENIHGADIMTSVILKWPDGRTVKIHVAGDAFANREPWALAWETGKPVLWIASGRMESMRGYKADEIKEATSLKRVDFRNPESVEEVHLSGWPKENGPSAECRGSMEKHMRIKAEGSASARSIQWANGNPTEFWLNILNIHVYLEDNGERFHFSKLPNGAEPESLPLSQLENALRQAAEIKKAQWEHHKSTRSPEQLKAMGDVSNAKPTATISAPPHLPFSVVQQAIKACNDAGIGPKVALRKEESGGKSVRGLSLKGLPQSDDITAFDDLYDSEDNRKPNVFSQSLGDVGPWLYYAAGADHFYLTVRPNPDVVKDIVYGPIPGHPVEKLNLAGWLRESPNHPDPGYARRVAHHMIRCGDELLSSTAFDWILTFDPPSPPDEYESLLDEVTAHLLQHPGSEKAKAVSEKLARLTAESEIAWDKKREQLADEIYQPGIAGSMRTEDGRKILWSGETESPLRVGVAGVEEGARWRIGETVKLDVFVCNSSPDPLRFAWTQRIDDGLSLELTDADGNVHRAEITMISTRIFHQRCELAPSEMLKVKTGAEFLIGKSGEDFRNRIPVETPGDYTLRVRCHLGVNDWVDSDGHEFIRPAGEWAGVVLSEAIPVSITGVDAKPAATDAKAAMKGKPGELWPEEKLAKLPFGEPDRHGLRVARFFEPRQDSYMIGDQVEGRLVIHNTGNAPVGFVTDHWHQHDAWLCTKNGGETVKPRIAERLGIHLSGPFLLGPGEVCEIGAQGVKIGTVPYDNEPGAVFTTVHLPAEAGDKFTCAWDVKLTYPGEEETTLRSGDFVFTTTKFVPDHPLELGIARHLGKYHLADVVKLQRSQSPTQTMAIIEWDSGERHKIDLEHRDRKEALVPVFWWRGGTALWIAETDALRKVDFSNPANVKETRWKWAEAPDDFGGAPDDFGGAPEEVQAQIRGERGHAELNERFRSFEKTKSGGKLPEEKLAALPFGKPSENGLRVAWIFDPMQAEYRVGDVLKCRIIFHNSGDAPVEFRTDQWHQDDTWHVTDGNGDAIPLRPVWFTGITPYQRYRLAPGETCEVAGRGVGIGLAEFAEATSQAQMGQQILAKPGDTVRCRWDVMLRPSWRKSDGTETEPEKLSTGVVTFKVLAALPVGERPPGVAKGTGSFDLALGVTLNLTTIGSREGFEKLASISWTDPAGSGKARISLPQSDDPKDYSLPTMVWPRGGNVLWILQPDKIRKIDFSKVGEIAEMNWPWEDAPEDFGGAPEKVQAEIRKNKPAAKETGYLNRSLREWDEMLATAKNSDRETLKALGFGKPEVAIPEEALPTLLALVESGQNATKCRCLGTLKKLENPGDEVLDTVIAALADESSKGNRFRAGYLLGDFRSRSDYVVPRLMPLLQKDGAVEQETAAFALGKIGTAAKDALPALQALLPGASESLKQVLETAIGRIRDTAAEVKDDAEAEGALLIVSDANTGEAIGEFLVLAGVPSGVSRSFESEHNTPVVNWQSHTIKRGSGGEFTWPANRGYKEMALRIEADGYVPHVIHGLQKGVKEVFNVKLSPDAGVRGSVQTPGGKRPAHDATVVLAMIRRNARLKGTTFPELALSKGDSLRDQWDQPVVVKPDDQGRFTLPDEPDPTAVVLILHGDGVFEQRFSEWKKAPDVMLEPWGRVHGQIRWGDQTGSGEKVDMIINRGDIYGYPDIVAQYDSTVADKKGQFVFERVLPGMAQFSRPFESTDADGNKLTSYVEGHYTHALVEAPHSPVLLGGYGRKVTGRLTGIDDMEGVTFNFHPNAPHIGFPGDGAAWAAWSKLKDGPSGPRYFRDGLKVEADGSFEITGVLPGSYQIFFAKDGRIAGGKFRVPPEDRDDTNPEPLDIGEYKVRK